MLLPESEKTSLFARIVLDLRRRGDAAWGITFLSGSSRGGGRPPARTEEPGRHGSSISFKAAASSTPGRLSF